MKTRGIACTMLAATSIAVLSACGNPIKANRDWTGLGISITAQAKVTTVGATISEQEQRLIGGLTNGSDRWSDVNGRTSIDAGCFRASVKTPIDSQLWNCQVVLNTGGQIYIAEGRTSDGIFGTFKSLDRPGSRSTVTITKVREVEPPATATVPDIPFRAGQTIDGGRGYLVRVSVRVG